MAAISLNGVSLPCATDAPMDLTKVGVPLVMADGTRRFVQRVSGATPIYKRTWALEFNGVTEAQRALLYTAATLNTTFTYGDQRGGAWTVQCEDDSYSESVTTISPDDTYHYDITLTVHEV